MNFNSVVLSSFAQTNIILYVVALHCHFNNSSVGFTQYWNVQMRTTSLLIRAKSGPPRKVLDHQTTYAKIFTIFCATKHPIHS